MEDLATFQFFLLLLFISYLLYLFLYLFYCFQKPILSVQKALICLGVDLCFELAMGQIQDKLDAFTKHLNERISNLKKVMTPYVSSPAPLTPSCTLSLLYIL